MDKSEQDRKRDYPRCFNYIKFRDYIQRYSLSITNLKKIWENPHSMIVCNTCYQDFANKYAHGMRKILQYVWYDRKGWVIFEYQKGIGKIKRDLRK